MTKFKLAVYVLQGFLGLEDVATSRFWNQDYGKLETWETGKLAPRIALQVSRIPGSPPSYIIGFVSVPDHKDIVGGFLRHSSVTDIADPI
ncbi:hypothetical protein [Nitrosomonas communis]|uniref:hypothetical protein n=1 Tax=Nitrosomonas communis TaxID=44574 RepID=UPI003D284CDD